MTEFFPRPDDPGHDPRQKSDMPTWPVLIAIAAAVIWFGWAVLVE